MKNISAELFIARRTARSRGNGRDGRGTLMERIAVVSVALSVAVMIVALAVIVGFKREISERLAGLGSHIVVTAVGSDPSSPLPVTRSDAAERALAAMQGVKSVRAYDARGGVVKSEHAMQGILLKGIEGGCGGTIFDRTLVAGSLPRTDGSERTKDILLSRTTASLLAVGAGDRVEMIFIDGDGIRRDRFSVSGIYSTGMEELEALALTDIRNVSRLAGREEGQIAGYEIMLDGFDRIEPLTAQAAMIVSAADDEDLRVRNIVELYPNIFDWLRTHDVNAAVVIGVMLVVALFNMVAALLIIVLERTRMIGILKSFGMADGALQRLFLYRAAAVTLRGVAWGDAAGLLLCGVQALWHPVKLNAAGYLLSQVPVGVVWWHVAAIDAGAAAVIVATMILPVRLVARIRPEQAIRYE